MRQMTSIDSGAKQHRSDVRQPDGYEFIEFGAHDDRLSSISSTRYSEPRTPEALGQQMDDDVPFVPKKSTSVLTVTETMMSRTTSMSARDTKWVDYAGSTSPSRLYQILDMTRHAMSLSLTVYRDHNPFKSDGRRRIKNFILSSGPAYQVPGSSPPEDTRDRRFTGWRMGALLNLILLATCLVAEVVMLIVAIVLDRKDSGSWLDGVIYSGSCTTTKRWITPITLLVNIVATITIGSSNYMMQCASAPTGPELRKAHDKGNFLRVGVSSPLNIDHVSKMKTALWWIMGITSVPVHLLLNSAFYATLQANNYAVAIFASDFQNQVLWENCSAVEPNSWSELICELYTNSETEQYERLQDPEACIRRYSDPLINQYSNVILVSSLESTETRYHTAATGNDSANFGKSFLRPNSSQTNSTAEDAVYDLSLAGLDALFGFFTSYGYSPWKESYYNPSAVLDSSLAPDPTSWLCPANYTLACSAEAALRNKTDWRVCLSEIPVSYCLSQKTPTEKCELKYSGIILGIVIGCDVLKILVVVLALRSTDRPLVTIGDVITYFMQFREPLTEKRCLLSQQQAALEAELISEALMRANPVDDPCWSEICFPIDFSKEERLPMIKQEELRDKVVMEVCHDVLPMAWTSKKQRWFNAVSKTGWRFLCMIIFACGFSVTMLCLVFALLIVMAAIICGFSLRPLRGDIPLIGVNSLAISAVCHNPESSATETQRPLLWGVTKKPENGQPGHCALSSGEVERLVPGQEYW